MRNSNLALFLCVTALCFQTTILGQTWVKQTSPTANNLNAVHFLDSNNGWIVGDGVKYKTTDGGVNWSTVIGNSLNINDVVLLNNDITFLATETGTYRNAGINSWFFDGSGHWNSADFIGSDIGYVVGNEGKMLKYYNGATEFNFLTSGTTNDLWGVLLMRTGWAVGKSGTF